ncbi:uncharacterized protein LOC132703267 [Cylas formicarius]|uniref:uncharacterized protein LOC132703267 n=1 Tax=Cylas formicarius TaxID=197179 RepID=UPI0029583832|nr:uncharacterized protein LOC132703267 [Cylas formicarius]
MNFTRTIEDAQNLILAFRQVNKYVFDNLTEEDKNVWLGRLRRNIIRCNKIVRSPKKNISMGLQRKIQTTIQHLKTIKQMILNHRHHFGMGLQNNSPANIKQRVLWEQIVSCFQGRVLTGVIINLKHKDEQQFLNDCLVIFKKKISKILKQASPMLKVNATFCGEFIKRKSDDQDVTDVKYISTKNAVIDLGTDLNEWFVENVKIQILNKLSEFQERDSGFALQKILYLEININKFEVGNGSSYIELPPEIKRKNACINIQNNDEACFYWSVVCACFPVHLKQHLPTSYPYYKGVLRTENCPTPMGLNQIHIFEKFNEISVNVYVLELIQNNSKSFYSVLPVRLTKEKREKHVNLLLIQNKYYPKINDFDPEPTTAEDHKYEKEEEIKYHYCYIKILSRLVSRQLSRHNGKKYICDRCLNYFSSETLLKDHERLCVSLNDYKVSFPKYDYVEFRNHIYKQTTPFVIYADFESQLKDVNLVISDKTRKYQKHEAYSAAYYFKCSYDDSL